MRKLSLGLLILFISNTLRAQERLPLQQILDSIRIDNPAFKVFDADIRSTQEAAKSARNWEAPQVGGGLWMTPYNPRYWAKSGTGEPGKGSFMLMAEQMLPNKKRQDAEEKYLTALSEPTRERKKELLNLMTAEAKKNYYQWMVLKKKLRILSDDEKLLDFMIRSAELRYKNGLGKMNVYYKLKAAIGEVQNQQLVIANDIQQKKIALNTMMNRNTATDFDIDTSYEIHTYQPEWFDTSNLVQHRSDLKALQREVNVNHLQQDLEMAKLKPVFGVQFVNMIGFGGAPMQYSLLGTVKIPMAKWSSRAAKANVESLKWKLTALDNQKRSILNESVGMSAGIEQERELKIKQCRLYEQTILPALRKNFQSLQNAYEQNTEELFALFDAWESLHTTQLEYLQQLQDLLVLQTQLEKILEIPAL
ncbi:MAG: TolC family protein [Bacteroidota bacterium]|nr:TolC family protein [Bacteroidota bacterium]